MQKININAIVMWFALSIGFDLFGGNWLMGLFIGLCISLLATFIKS